MTFGQRLTQLRKEKGYSTRNELAECLNIPSTTLRNYETDAREPGHSFLIQIANLFNVSVDYLLGMTDNRERMSPYNLKISEFEHIKKYRFIMKNHPEGASAVDYILNHEYSIAQRIEMNEEHIKNLESRTAFIESQNSSGVHMCIYTYMQKIAAAGNGFYFDDIPTETIEAPYMEGADFIIGVSGDSMEPTYSDGDLVYVEKRQIIETGEIGIFIVNGECFIKEAGEIGLISHNKNYNLISGNQHIICVGKVLGKVQTN